jgi:hypothetical protein
MNLSNPGVGAQELSRIVVSHAWVGIPWSWKSTKQGNVPLDESLNLDHHLQAMENEAVRSKGRCSMRYRISSKLGRTRRKFDEETWRRIKEEASTSRRGVISSTISYGATAIRSLITVTTTTLFKSSSILIILSDQSRIQGKGI